MPIKKHCGFLACTLLFAQILLPGSVLAQDELRGLVKPLHSLELSMPVDGVVAVIKVREGQQLKADQMVLQLDDRLQALEVSRKKAVWQDKSTLNMLAGNREQMEDIAQRKEALFNKSRSISQSDLNRTRIQLSTARGEYEAARQNEHQQQLDYKIAAQVLDYYSLKAPISGEMVEILPEVGEWVKVGDVVARMVNTAVCIVELDVSVEVAQLLRQQKHQQKDVQLKIHLPKRDLLKSGKVVFVSPVADEGSTLVRSKIEFENRDGRVIPGVTASLVLAEALSEEIN